MQSRLLQILLVEDNAADAQVLLDRLDDSHARFRVVHVNRFRDISAHVKSGNIDVILLDLQLPDSPPGLGTFQQAYSLAPSIPIIVLTGSGDEETALSAVRMGAQDYLIKSACDRTLLTRAIHLAHNRHALLCEARSAQAALKAQFESIPLPAYLWGTTDDGFVLMNKNPAAEAQAPHCFESGAGASEILRDLPDILAGIQDCARVNGTITREWTGRFFSTDTRTLTITYVPAPGDLVLMYIEDITYRKEAETSLLRSRDELERTVAQRTEELSASNEQLHRELLLHTHTSEALRLEKELLAVTLRSIGDGVITTDAEGEIRLMNRAAETLTGTEAAHAIGRRFEDVVRVVEVNSRKVIENPITAVMSGGALNIGSGKVALLRPDGPARMIDLDAAPIHGLDRSAIGVVVVMRDVTQEWDHARKLKREAEIHAGLVKLYRPLISPGTGVEKIALDTLEVLRGLTRSAHGFLSEIHPVSGSMRMTTLSPSSQPCLVACDKLPPTFSRSGDGRYPGLWGHSLNTGRGFYTNDARNHSASVGTPPKHINVESLLSMPIWLGPESVGLICLANPEKPYDDGDLEAVERIAAFFALALRRKRDEKAVQESEERYRRLFEIAGDAILLLDQSPGHWGAILAANASAQELYGYSSAELASMNVRHICEPEDAEYFREALARIGDGRWIRREIKQRTKDGAALHVEMNCGVITAGGKRFIMSLGRDNTARKHAEELTLQAERLRAVADLAAGVAHNFNNLLQIISGGIQLSLMELELGEISSTKETLTQMLQSARFGSETVKRLQRFSGLRSLTCAEVRTSYDLAGTARQAVEVSKIWWLSTPEKLAIQVDFVMNLRGPCMVDGSESQMFEVVINLLKNAVESMPKGGRIEVTTFTGSGSAVLMVRDSGEGIAPEDLPRIFQPFFTTKGFQSTGMGLAGSYGIIKTHGGTIAATSAQGKGTEFRVELPLSASPPPAPRFESGEAHEGALNILVVDDLGIVLKMLKLNLEKFGHSVFTASSGAEALELLRGQDVDFIICDLGMPTMNGWELGKQTLALSRARGRDKIPFVMLTGWGEGVADEQKMAECGVDKILAKPIENSQLLRAVREFTPQGHG